MYLTLVQKKSLLMSFVVGTLVFAFIIWVLGPEKMLGQLKQMNPWWLLAALFVEILAIMAMTFRWNIFVNAAGHKAHFWNLLLITTAGTALNNVTPSTRVGGEPLRAYLLKKKYGIRTSTGLATVVIEKIADMTAFSIITLLAIAYAFCFLNIPGYIVLLLLLSFLFSASVAATLLYVTMRKKIRLKWVAWLIDKYQGAANKIPFISYYRDRMDDSLENYYKYAAKIAKKGVLANGILASLAYWGLEIIRAYVIFVAFGLNVPAAVIAAVYVLANIVGSLPLPPGGIETTMIVIYSSSAINTVTAGAVTIIDRLISFWLVILVGIPIGWYLSATGNNK